MKVGKEEIIGLLVALDEFVRKDWAAEQDRWTSLIDRLASEVSMIPGLTTNIAEPTPNGRYYPILLVSVDYSKFGHTARQTLRLLEEGAPPICVLAGYVDKEVIGICPTQLTTGDEVLIGARLRDLVPH